MLFKYVNSNFQISIDTDPKETVGCACTCTIEPNVTLVEKIDKMKKELTVPKEGLSSFKRKLTSAEDTRPSAERVGYLGTALLTLVGIFIFGGDFLSVIRFLFCREQVKH